MQLYASWCVHSRAALAEFLETIQYIVDHNITEMVVGKIDIVKHSGEFCSEPSNGMRILLFCS